MKKFIFLMILLTSLLFISCGNDTPTATINHQGENGYSCYANNTCNEGLICNNNNKCEKEAVENHTGEEGYSCYANNTCNEGLICKDSKCKKEIVEEHTGEEGYSCYANNTCNERLICKDSKCEKESSNPCEGISCGNNEICNDGTCVCDTGFHDENNLCVNDSLNNGLVAHYEFEGNLNDTGSYGNDGTCSTTCPTLTTDINGIENRAYEFTGNQRVKIESSSLNITSDLSITAWIYPTSSYLYQKIFTREVHGKVTYRFGIDMEKLRIFLHQGTTADQTNSNLNILNLNQWQMITVVREGNGLSSNSVSFYLNGIFVNSDNFREAPEVTNENASYIGDIFNASHPASIEGKLDDLRIYNRTLTESEIQELYQIGKSE